MNPLEKRVEELERRIALLEGGGRSPAGPAPADLLALIQSRPGTILYGGAAGFGERDYLWAMEHPAAEVAAAHWPAAATLLEHLGSAPRLALLAAVLHEPRTSRELQEILGETSTGHLYHHLKDLQSAGLLVQPRRGEYAIAPHAVVPLMTIVAIAMELGS